MSLKLALDLFNIAALDNGSPTHWTLDRRGLDIGRSGVSDWSLPDPNNQISRLHCEINFRAGAYTVTDKSTNGTFVNGERVPTSEARPIKDGDVISICDYEIRCRLIRDGVDISEDARSFVGAVSDDWLEAPRNPSPPPPPEPPISIQKANQPVSWGEDMGEASLWDDLVKGLDVDWDRGFRSPGEERHTPISDPAADVVDVFGLKLDEGSAPAFAPPQQTRSLDEWDDVPMSPEPPSQAPLTSPPPGGAPASFTATHSTSDELWGAFLRGSELSSDDIKVAPNVALEATGRLFRQLAGGLVVMLEARSRAKAQLGASGTILEPLGNNPLKFSFVLRKTLAQLINPVESGFMPAEMAVEDAYKDLQAHQLATLAAVRGALTATLDRFSPQAIRNRAETGGLLAKILPGARDAALWKAYETEFEGVVKGSSEAFMDVFSKEFREAYERTSAEMKRKK